MKLKCRSFPASEIHEKLCGTSAAAAATRSYSTTLYFRTMPKKPEAAEGDKKGKAAAPKGGAKGKKGAEKKK